MQRPIAKLAATILLVVFVMVYALVAMAVGGRLVGGAAEGWKLLYALVAGLLWIGPAALIIRFMLRGRGRGGA